MKEHKLIKRGYEHKNFCEDFLFSGQINDIKIGCVFDGCSTGDDSHFASTFFAKCMNYVVNGINFYFDKSDFDRNKIESLVNRSRESAENKDLKELANIILFLFLLKVKNISKDLNISQSELLSTISFYLYDEYEKRLLAYVIGDGFISVDGERYEVDQDNVPNYLAYHLDNIEFKDDLDDFLQEEHNCFQLYQEDVEDFVISSDGILSFIQKYTQDEECEMEDPISYLIDNERMINNGCMLSRKVNMLQNKNGFVHLDDLGIIRVYNRQKNEN